MYEEEVDCNRFLEALLLQSLFIMTMCYAMRDFISHTHTLSLSLLMSCFLVGCFGQGYLYYMKLIEPHWPGSLHQP
jgi:hypothetical protein